MRMPVTVRAMAVTACAMGVFAVGAVSAQAATSPRGTIDVDLRRESGGLVGHVHGHLDTAARGRGTFRPAHGVRLANEIVGLRGRRAGGGWTITGRAHGLRLALRMDARGTVRGRGTASGRAVSVAGIGRERLPALKQGMRMLVVGDPSGDGYAALKRLFKPVRYRPDRHHRAWSLRDRRDLHSYAALVFGPDVNVRDVSAHALLRAFYGAGKWIIAAPAFEGSHAALGTVHPYVHPRATPAVAVRSVGPEGAHHTVKPTVVYPEIARSAGPAAARRRGAWFRAELRRLGAAHMHTARNADGGKRKAHAAQVLSPFSLSSNMAGIELSVTYNHEFALRGSRQVDDWHPCAWNVTTSNAWCEDTDVWRYATTGDKTQKCRYFLSLGYTLLDAETVRHISPTKNEAGAYTVHPGALGLNGGFIQEPGDECPQSGSQIGRLSGTDYYYALAEINPSQHTLVLLTDATLNATDTGSLSRNKQNNGTGKILVFQNEDSPRCVRCPVTMPNTAWFLGRYTHTVTFAGSQLTDLNFVYSGNRSFPQNTIEFESQSTSVSSHSDFNIGVFGETPTGSFSGGESRSASISVSVPSWKVIPQTSQGRQIVYDWRTNNPVSWDTIASGGSGSFDLNTLNVRSFVPTSMTVWSGQFTYGLVKANVNRTLQMVEHYTRYDRGDGAMKNTFATTDVSFSDIPDGVTPAQIGKTEVVGPGINLCDAAVMVLAYKTKCAELAPVPPGTSTIYIGPECQGWFMGPMSFKIGGQLTGDFDCDHNSQKITVPSYTSTDVVQVGGSETVYDIACSSFGTGAFAKADSDRVTIPGSALTPGREVVCYATVGR
jgi:hypothetical protein